MKKNLKQHDEQGRITTLGELLSCSRCGEPFVKAEVTFGSPGTIVYRPNCECIKKKIRISVGQN